MKKYILGAVLSLGILVSPAFTQAAGLTSSQINAIVSLLQSFGADQSVINNVQTSLTGNASSSGGSAFCHTFNNNFSINGSSGEEVSFLQTALVREGVMPSTNWSNGIFDEDTASAVVAFQAKYGIRQTGYVGPITRAKLNNLYGCSNPVPAPQPPTTCTAADVNGDGRVTQADADYVASRSGTSVGVTGYDAKADLDNTGTVNSSDVSRIKAALVSCSPAPTVTVTASPTTVTAGQSTTITWSSTNATNCSFNLSSSDGPSGSRVVFPTGPNTTYPVQCNGVGGTSVGSVTVAVAPTTTPTIVITNVQYSPSSPRVNDRITTTVTVTNSGSVDQTTPFRVNVQGTTATVSSLAARTTTTVTVTNAFTFSFPGTQTLNTAIIDSNGNTGNVFTNTLTFTSAVTTFNISWSGGTGNVQIGLIDNRFNPNETNPWPVLGWIRTTNPPSGSLSWNGNSVSDLAGTVTWPVSSLSQGPFRILGITADSHGNYCAGGLSNLAAGNCNYSISNYFTLTNPQANITLSPFAATTPTVTLVASPTTITAGQSATLRWSSTNATSCTWSGGGASWWPSTLDTNGYQYTTVLTATQTYTMTCTGPGGSTTQSVTVTVTPTPAPTITVNQSSIQSGQSVRFSFTFPSNTVRATLMLACPSGVNTGSSDVCNNKTIDVTSNTDWTAMFFNTTSQPLNVVPNYYVYTSSNPNYAQVVSSQVTVTPTPAPTATITANPTTITAGQSTVISWSSTNASQCILGGDFVAGNGVAQGTPGSLAIYPTKSPSTYSVRCTDSGQTVSTSASVAVTVVVSAACMAGDMNGDGRVTQADADYVASKSGTYVGAVGYDAKADLDNTGTVNSSDVSRIKALLVSCNTVAVAGANQTASALNAFSSATNSATAGSGFSYVWNRDLQVGSPYSADVTALQTALTREGVYTGEITGGFYDQTYTAVKKFQQKYGIEATGYVGPFTRERLNALY